MSGLLRILHSYKFTIVENTPIDQEIALDPELLGKDEHWKTMENVYEHEVQKAFDLITKLQECVA